MNRQAEFAWPQADRPGLLHFAHRPSEQVQAALLHALAKAFPRALDSSAQLRALRPSSEPVGRYQLTTGDGVWFVRVTSRLGRPELEKAIADCLLSEGASVSPMIAAGLPLHWDDRTYRVDVQPFIEGRHFGGALADLTAVATLLFRCHTALCTFPRRDEVRSAAALRHERLAEVRGRVENWLRTASFDDLGEQADWASAHRQWLQEMVDGFDPHFEQLPDAQCLHGEVHQGNVLFRAKDGAPVLIDFEEAVHVFAPPSWDLAFVIQRFALSDNPSPAVLKERLATIATAYGSHPPNLASTMRQIAWFTMAVILDLRLTDGVITPLAEYDKFVTLARQAAEYEHAL